MNEDELLKIIKNAVRDINAWNGETLPKITKDNIRYWLKDMYLRGRVDTFKEILKHDAS